MDGGRWTVVSGQWAVGSGQWLVVSGQWLVGSGQWAVVSGQWAVAGGQWPVGRDERENSRMNPVSWTNMQRGVEKVRQRLLRVAAALRDARLDYAVVGGNAVAAWVSRVDATAVRNTRDVDILVRRSDFERIKAALEGAGFLYRHVASLGRGGALDAFLDAADPRLRDAVHVVWAGEKVTAGSAEASPDVAQSENAGEFQLIELEPLVRMKLTAFRDKDRMHLRDLLSVGLIDSTWPGRLPPVLAARLQTILADPEG